MCCSHHTITFITGDGQTIFGYFQLRCPIMKCQKHSVWCHSSIQPAWYRFTSTICTFIEFLTEWCVRIRFSQNVSISVFIKWMFEWVAMSRQFYKCIRITKPTFFTCWPWITARYFAFWLTTNFREVLVSCNEKVLVITVFSSLFSMKLKLNS